MQKVECRLQGAGAERKGTLLLNMYRIFVWDLKKVVAMFSSDS
jgi:hypothetical protein